MNFFSKFPFFALSFFFLLSALATPVYGQPNPGAPGSTRGPAPADYQLYPGSCDYQVPVGHYFIVETPFQNYDYAQRRMAMFRAYGFEHVYIVHTDCQSFDIEGSFYLLVLSLPHADKETIYQLIEELYKKAVPLGVHLNNARITQAR